MPSQIMPYLSEARMVPYLNCCDNDPKKALELYVRNIELSSAAYAALHKFEVLLRNAIDRELRDWNQKKTGKPEWGMFASPVLLGVLGNQRLYEARKDAKNAVGKKRDFTHDDVIAQFSLGTWRYLLPSQKDWAKQTLWDEALSKSFPYQYEIPTHQLVKWVSISYDFRNRVAHHEPIFNIDLRAKRQSMRHVLNTIGSDVRKWFIANDTFGQAITDFYNDWPVFDIKQPSH